MSARDVAQSLVCRAETHLGAWLEASTGLDTSVETLEFLHLWGGL